jgi:putative flippase GtrA
MAARTSDVHDVTRFLIAGGINTALTASVYLLAAIVLQPVLAYALSWGVGLVFVAIVYPDRVFKGGRTDLRSRFLLAAATVGVFLVGAASLEALVGLTHIHQIAFFITLAITASLNFALARTILRGRQ